jgi:D-serine deaminase-like pyridoxal phosphate-dependent protein
MTTGSMNIGIRKDDLDTPALWVDLDKMERNISRLASYFREAGVGWRPHTKGIKVPAIAHKCIAAGAIGVTCAKLAEAEVMAAAGVKDILIANQVVGPIKATRLVNIQRHADVMVAVDSVHNAQEISRAATSRGVRVRVLIEVNSGMDRCGVEPGQPVVDLAMNVAALPGIHLAGVMAWEGHVVAMKDPVEKARVCEASVKKLTDSAELCRKAGLRIDIVSCGGSGSYQITSHLPGVTEIQAGGAVFTDVTYAGWGVPLEPSLFVLATVVSRPAATRAVCDAGQKTIDNIVSSPKVMGYEGVRVKGLSAEHGTLELAGAEVPLKVGDKIDLMTSYGDFTVYKHDYLYGVRSGMVETQWSVQARGALQ